MWHPGILAARKWRENEKMKRKWRKNEEMEGDSLSAFPHFLFISLPLYPFPISKMSYFSIKHDLDRLCFMIYTPSQQKFWENSKIFGNSWKILKFFGNFWIFLENFDIFWKKMKILEKFGFFWKISNYNCQSRRQIITARGVYCREILNTAFLSRILQKNSYALWENNSGLLSLRESSASCEGLIKTTNRGGGGSV